MVHLVKERIETMNVKRVNNLDLGDEPVHHTDLRDAYDIDGKTYTLKQIIATIAAPVADEWNEFTMSRRLAEIKSYLKNIEAVPAAEPVNMGDGEGSGDNEDNPAKLLRMYDEETAAAQVEELMASNERMANTLGAIRERLGIAPDNVEVNVLDVLDAFMTAGARASEDVVALRKEVNRLQISATKDVPLHGDVSELKAPY